MNEPKFYSFMQSNPGGYFTDDPNLGVSTYIQAHSEEEAFKRAEEVGIYFDGVAKGIDCECCNDRWRPVCDEIEPEPRQGWTYEERMSLHARNELETVQGIDHKITLIYLDGTVETHTCTSVFKSEKSSHVLQVQTE